MTKVIGVDFGTLSVRASIVDSKQGLVATSSAEYPLNRRKDNPDFATQSHDDQMVALAKAVEDILKSSGVKGREIASIALDTTGSTVVMVDSAMQPLGDYYMWCDHRAKVEAEEITAVAKRCGLEAIDWCGGVYSSEWGFSKLLHWLRQNPQLKSRMATALEHCDMVAATLCGVRDPSLVKRSICAMGHKWMWNEKLGGLPSDGFLTSVDPLLSGVRARLDGEYATSDKLAGHLSRDWADRLGLTAGIPIPVGAFDAHWDAVGAGVRLGDMVNVIGTSTCIIGTSDSQNLVPGLCGVVPGSVHPQHLGIEAGLSAVGDIFAAIASRAGSTVAALTSGLENYRAGQTGLLRMVWDNGDRTVLVNPRLSGVTLGWNLTSTAQDEVMAAIEGTAFHTRVIFDHMAAHGVNVRRVINAGGIGQKNDVLNQVYANVLGRPVYSLAAPAVGLGSAIFAFLAAKTFKDVDEAQDAICPGLKTHVPEAGEYAVYQDLYGLFSQLYFGFGEGKATPFGKILPQLIAIRDARNQSRQL
jgi:L-ribulokinase